MTRQKGAVGRSPIVRVATSDGEDVVVAARAASESVPVVRTGPTGTNVNDLRVVLVGDPGEPPRRRRSLSTACHPDTFGSDSPHSR